MAQKTPSALAQYQEQASAAQLPDHLRNLGFLIPTITSVVAVLTSAEGDVIMDRGDDSDYDRLMREAYLDLANTTATLLDLLDVHEISDEAIHSVTHRLAAQVDTLVSLHSRVDHLYRSYRQGEADHIHADAEKLWAALEFRAENVVGVPLTALLTPAAED